jgi:hypothetical protein
MPEVGATPEQEMCSHCTSWCEGSGYECHQCGAVWPVAGTPCPKCEFIYPTADDGCPRCDHLRDGTKAPWVP